MWSILAQILLAATASALPFSNGQCLETQLRLQLTFFVVALARDNIARSDNNALGERAHVPLMRLRPSLSTLRVRVDADDMVGNSWFQDDPAEDIHSKSSADNIADNV